MEKFAWLIRDRDFHFRFECLVTGRNFLVNETERYKCSQYHNQLLLLRNMKSFAFFTQLLYASCSYLHLPFLTCPGDDEWLPANCDWLVLNTLPSIITRHWPCSTDAMARVTWPDLADDSCILLSTWYLYQEGKNRCRLTLKKYILSIIWIYTFIFQCTLHQFLWGSGL